MVKNVICKFALEMCSDKFPLEHALHCMQESMKNRRKMELQRVSWNGGGIVRRKRKQANF